MTQTPIISYSDPVTVLRTATVRDAYAAIASRPEQLAVVTNDTGQFLTLLRMVDVRQWLDRGRGLAERLDAMPLPPVQPLPSDSPEIIDCLSACSTGHLALVDQAGVCVRIASRRTRSRINQSQPVLGPDELEGLRRCITEGWISSAGEFVSEFERRMAAYCSRSHGVSTSNGTSALHLALEACGVGPGDEVIVPTLTFGATANAVRHAGATPVFADSCSDHWTIDPKSAREKVTSKTRALVVVHLYGHPCEMTPLQDLAREQSLRLIEDAAEAHGAEYRGAPVGSLGDAAVFSFYGNKILSTGEGGMLVTNDPEVAKRARLLRDHGMDPTRRYWHLEVGYNYRLTNLQAAIGCAQLERLREWVDRRRAIRRIYHDELGGLAGVSLQSEAPWARSSAWLTSLQLDPTVSSVSPRALSDRLSLAGIESRFVFPPLHLQPAYATGAPPPCPIAEHIANTGLSLPSGCDLMDCEVREVARAVRDALTVNPPRA